MFANINKHSFVTIILLCKETEKNHSIKKLHYISVNMYFIVSNSK
jgi:hypothetical protein